MSNTSPYFHHNEIALKGIDPVAYFTMNRPVQGNEENTVSWKGLTWYFANEEHQQLFKTNPEKYAPQFGGYCAFGASEGYKASTKPGAFSIVEGKLYLNFANYVKRRWIQMKDEKIASAEKQWSEVKSTEPIKAHPIPIWWKYQLLKLIGKDLFG